MKVEKFKRCIEGLSSSNGSFECTRHSSNKTRVQFLQDGEVSASVLVKKTVIVSKKDVEKYAETVAGVLRGRAQERA